MVAGSGYLHFLDDACGRQGVTIEPERSWYVLKDDQQIGPIPDATFREFVSDGLVRRTDFIWRQGLPKWVAAELLLQFDDETTTDLRPPPLPKHAFSPLGAGPQSLPPPLPKNFAVSDVRENGFVVRSDVSPAVSASQPRPNKSASRTTDDFEKSSLTERDSNGSYLVRHWRGTLSLPVSYWFNGFLGYLIATIAVTAIGASSLLRTEFSPVVTLLSMVGVWTITFVILCWQVVGTWRSATNYSISNVNAPWAIFAKLSLAIAVISTLVQFSNRGIPQVREMYLIYAGDEEVGKYAFRVLRDGAELEFSGGITFGAAKEFARFIDAMGALAVVHLNSKGGRIEEAQRIGDLIKKRGLDTFVSGSCLSACTIIFLSGKNRFVTDTAKVGFHQPNFAGLTEENRIDLAKKEESRLRRLGLSAAFAKRANEVPPEDIWTPEASELIKEGVATRIVDGSKFALSGMKTSDITQENGDRILRNIPMYAAVERMDAPTYQKILREFVDGLQRGKSVDELTAQISPILNQLFSEALPHVSSAVLVEYVDMTVRHMKLLNRESAAACYMYANPQNDRNGLLVALGAKFPTIVQDQTAMKTKVFGAYRGKLSLGADGDLVSRSIADVVKSLERRYGQEANVIAKDEVSPSDYSSYCRVVASFYEEILRLPSSEKTATLRKLFREK